MIKRRIIFRTKYGDKKTYPTEISNYEICIDNRVVNCMTSFHSIDSNNVFSEMFYIATKQINMDKIYPSSRYNTTNGN